MSMISPRGAYQLNRDSIEEFWEIYCTSVQNGKIVGIAEKPAHYIPILCDIDIKILESDLENINYDKENNHLYTQKQLNSVIEVYQSVLRNIIDGCTDEQLTCVVLEKPMYTITKNGVTYYKSGFHLQMMGVFLSKMDHENQFLPRVRDIIKELKIFEDLGFEDSGSLVDGGYTKSPWLLYGGKKDGDNMTPYKITKIINSVGEEISTEEAFKYYSIYDVKEKLMIIRDNIDFYLPRILSIVPNGRLCNELKYGLSSPIRDSISKKDKERIKDSDTEVSITQTLRTSKKLLPMLANFRADDRNEWMTIGWILHSIGDGCPEAFEQWLEFSSKNEEKFDENECLNLWEKMVKRDFTIGTLKYYAKLDNPELYKEYQKEQGDKFVRESLEGSSHNDIAKLMFEEYGTEFVCSSFVNKTWFQFKNHHWEEIEDGIFLRELISSDIIKIYGKHGSELFANSAINEDPGYQEKIKRLQKLIANLKNSPFKTNIMKEAAEVFFDRKFKHKLDSNPYLIGFKNGVYDLKLNTFRSGRPEDYISKCMPINYINFNNTDNRVLEVNDYLEKVFPDKSVRTYFLDQTSDVFEGGNNQKVIIFWTGEGDNAKSVTQNIVERMLGEYAIKFNTTLVTGKKSSTGSANPELARAGGGVRWAVLEEPDGDEELNIGILKSLSGNDTYWARDLFEKGKSTREIKPMFKLTFICLDGNTSVSLTNGISVSLNKLINNKQKLLSWDSKTDGLLNTSQHAFIDKGEQECIMLTLLDGRQITCTPNHKFLTNNNEWIEAKDIKLNNMYLKMGIDYPKCDDIFDDYDYILNFGNYKFNLNIHDDRIKCMAYVRLLGYMLTDGTCNSILYPGHKIDCENILLDIEILTGKRPSIVKNKKVFNIHIPNELKRSFNIASHVQKGGRVNNEMILPEFIFDKQCPTFIIREFIASLFGGDGILPSLVKNSFGNIQLVSSKIEKYTSGLIIMFEKLSVILFERFGIKSCVRKQLYTNNININDDINHDIDDDINNDDDIEDDINDDDDDDINDNNDIVHDVIKKYHVFLNINKKDSILKFCENIGFRYCCHKSYRIIAVKSYLRYRNSIIEQNKLIINRTKELFDKYNRQNPKPFIVQTQKNTDKIIYIYKSTQKAQHSTGILHSNIFSACKRNGTSGGFKWEFKHQEKEFLDEEGCETLMEAHIKAVEEIKNNNGIINEKYIITYTQVRRYIYNNIIYKMPSINIKNYLIENDLFKFCNQGLGDSKYHHYSVHKNETTLPCYKMPIIFTKYVGIKHVYDINIDRPYSNFIAEGSVVHNCNELRPIRNSDAAFWNRAKVIPFESTFVRKGDPCPTSYEEQLLQKRFPRDTDFDKKIIGLLEPFAWILLEHRKNIQGKGRVEPEKVKMATEQYRKQNDIYRQFVDECIVESQNYITLIQIYASFREWYKQGFTGGCSITKNDLQKHFLKIWGEPEKGFKWFGHRIITSDEELENNIEDGTAIALTEDDLIDYDDTNSICSSRSSKSRKTTPNIKQTRILL